MPFSVVPFTAGRLNLFSSKTLYSRIIFSTFSLSRAISFRHGPTPPPLLFRRRRTPRISSQQSFGRSRAMAANGEARPKRRQSPVKAIERPGKLLKQQHGARTPGDSTPANGTVYDVENEADSVPIINTIAAANDSPEWQRTIEGVIKSVVSIHFCQTCSFDTDLSTSSQATGFVVDAERGYILTNRHVVCAGPFWGYCVFDNHEEVSELMAMT